MSNIYDVAIIGAGPVGIFTGFQCGYVNLKYVLIDSLDKIGGQCVFSYPEKYIYDIPGLPLIKAGDLIKNLEKQMNNYPPQKIFLKTNITSITKEKDIFILNSEKEQVRCKNIIFSSGNGVFQPIKINIKSANLYEGKNILYSLSKEKIKEIEGKKVMILGGGDSAVDYCMQLHSKVEKMYLVHRRDKFRCHESSENTIRKLHTEEKIKILTPFIVKDICFEKKEKTITLINCANQKKLNLEIDYLLVFFGICQSDVKKISIDQCTSFSSEGFYAVGDCAKYKNKITLIAVGFAEGIQASRDIYRKIKNKEANFPYSTCRL